jgi:hypothetical protein
MQPFASCDSFLVTAGRVEVAVVSAVIRPATERGSVHAAISTEIRQSSAASWAVDESMLFRRTSVADT